MLLFAASFPNPFFSEGLPFCAWIALVPVFWLANRLSIAASALWGAVYGYGAYNLFNYWLGAFHPLAGHVAGGLFLLYFALLFPLFRLSTILFPRRGYLLQWLLWLGWEYLRTLGFAGYSYGIMGYSQWKALPLIQIAAIFGVWGVSALVVFPSAYLAAALRDWSPGAALKGIGGFFRRERLPGLLWLAALILSLGYGFLAPRDYSAAPKIRAALIQPNNDPWKGGISQYRANFQTLRRLSLEALAAESRTNLVVWSETAFIPRIYWHSRYREDPASWALVQDLLAFLGETGVPFVIGNDDARREPPKNPEDNYRVDYNAALLFRSGALAGQYRKTHLVPFTEHFPYKKEFPWVYDILVKANTHMWEPGRELTIFEIPLPGEGAAGEAPLRFATPICFEDTFGYLSRDFVRRGAELIVNLSNDSWSKSLACQMQHLGMAVFRAVENRRSMARATASGQTCGIAPDGRITAMAPDREEAWLTVELPLLRTLTPYTRFGDIWGQSFALLGLLILLTGTILNILKQVSKKAAG
ncbi:MAG: apolipoprotein N-acyltransferase [Spirochaetaceae bacterium]|nr:apolipoprotein N-acyltransferase [Spirochaetaceae bacterium]